MTPPGKNTKDSDDVLTFANQLTLLRMLLIPAFIVLTIEGELGWALSVFALAGITDAPTASLRVGHDSGRRWAHGSIRWPTSSCSSARSSS